MKKLVDIQIVIILFLSQIVCVAARDFINQQEKTKNWKKKNPRIKETTIKNEQFFLRTFANNITHFSINCIGEVWQKVSLCQH